MVDDLITIGIMVMFFLLAFVIVKIIRKIDEKKQERSLKVLKSNFKSFFGPELAEEKLLKDLQTKTVVKPKLKSLAQDLDEAYQKATSLEHQIKHDPKALEYSVYNEYLRQARSDAEAHETFFFNMLQIAKDLKFVPEETDFKKCLKF